MDDLEKGFQELAHWANSNPRPQPPEYVPGLPGVNRQLSEEYRIRLVAWCVGKAEAFMHGLKED